MLTNSQLQTAHSGFLPLIIGMILLAGMSHSYASLPDGLFRDIDKVSMVLRDTSHPSLSANTTNGIIGVDMDPLAASGRQMIVHHLTDSDEINISSERRRRKFYAMKLANEEVALDANFQPCGDSKEADFILFYPSILFYGGVGGYRQGMHYPGVGLGGSWANH